MTSRFWQHHTSNKQNTAQHQRMNYLTVRVNVTHLIECNNILIVEVCRWFRKMLFSYQKMHLIILFYLYSLWREYDQSIEHSSVSGSRHNTQRSKYRLLRIESARWHGHHHHVNHFYISYFFLVEITFCVLQTDISKVYEISDSIKMKNIILMSHIVIVSKVSYYESNSCTCEISRFQHKIF